MPSERDDTGSEEPLTEEGDVVTSVVVVVVSDIILAQRRVQLVLRTMVHRSPDAVIRHLLQSLPPRPFHKDELNELISKVLQDTPCKFSSPDVRRGQWELALKSDIFDLAVRVSPLFHPTTFLSTASLRLKKAKHSEIRIVPIMTNSKTGWSLS